MSCFSARPGPLRCPDLPEVVAALVALLPRGRAWQSNEGGPIPFKPGAFGPGFNKAAFADDGAAAGSVLFRFWHAVAAVYWFVNKRICDLRLEFWCATHTETHDEWMREYGLPDPCDPFPDLCVKVAALGGQRCAYFNSIVARMGWSVDCIDWADGCGAKTGCARAGRARAGGAVANRLSLVVHLNESPAYVARQKTRPPLAGALRSGFAIRCDEPADIGALKCLINRIAPAHVAIDYHTIEA